MVWLGFLKANEMFRVEKSSCAVNILEGNTANTYLLVICMLVELYVPPFIFKISEEGTVIWVHI